MRTNTHWNENLEEERPRYDDHEDILIWQDGHEDTLTGNYYHEDNPIPEKRHSDTLTGNEDKRVYSYRYPHLK
jgi:hypothetical protein